MVHFMWIPWIQALSRCLPRELLYGTGLIALAEIPALASKTALWGSPSLYDAFSIAPGLHKQREASRLSNGEYPACAAMTTGYVFRVENEAMVYFLQRVGRPGQLTTLSVSHHGRNTQSATAARYMYTTMMSVTLLALALLASLDDLVAVSSLAMLVLISVTNMILIERRTKLGWKGQKEPGSKSDLLILLSQDRWIRIQGMTDDVKVVTSGQWLRQPSAVEDMVYSLISIFVHLAAGTLFAASHEGRLIFFLLMLVNTFCLQLANALTDQLTLYGRTVKMTGNRQMFARRLDMARELVKEAGNDTWCEKMGIILTKDSASHQGEATGVAHM